MHHQLSNFCVVYRYKKAVKSVSPFLSPWESRGQKKVALRVPSLSEMLKLQSKAEQKGLTHCVIADAGRTQVAAGSQTVLAIGPAPQKYIDEVTGKLKLL